MTFSITDYAPLTLYILPNNFLLQVGTFYSGASRIDLNDSRCTKLLGITESKTSSYRHLCEREDSKTSPPG